MTWFIKSGLKLIGSVIVGYWLLVTFGFVWAMLKEIKL